MKLVSVRLLVDNFDACYEFYHRTLGFEVTWGQKGEAYASFSVNESMLISIYKRELMNDHLEFGTIKRRVNDPHMSLIIEVDNVDEVYNRLNIDNIKTINKPHDMPGWGIRCFHLQDPDGNVVEINKVLPKDNWSNDMKDHPDAEQYE